MKVLILFALLDGLWQGALLVALVALLVRLLPRANAATACALWTATYCLVAALPLINLLGTRPVVVPPPRLQQIFPILTTRAADPSSRRTIAHSERTVWPLESNRSVLALIPTVDQANAVAVRVAGPALALWTIVALALVLRLVWSYGTVLALKRGARNLVIPGGCANLMRGRHAELGGSPHVRVPCAIGFMRPMIVLPTALAGALGPEDLARVIVHEHAHIRRYDDWSNALQRLLGAILFFHPALHYVARRLDFEREVACDDLVLEAVGGPIEYAQCLAKIVERQVRGKRLAPVPGFFVGRSQALTRVDRLLDVRRNISPHIARSGPLAAAAIVLASLLLTRLQVPVLAAPTLELAPAARVAPTHHDVEPPANSVDPPRPVPHPIPNPMPHPVPQFDVAQDVPRSAIADAQGARPPVDLLDALANAGYPRLRINDLIELANHGVNGDFIVAMGTVLPSKPCVSQLLALADHGVQPALIREMAGLGYTHLTVDQVIGMSDAGVSARLIKQMHDHGYRDLTVKQLIKLAESGF